MVPFEHSGPEWRAIGRARNAVLGGFLLIGAILLFPLTLLMLFLQALGYLDNPQPLRR